MTVNIMTMTNEMYNQIPIIATVSCLTKNNYLPDQERVTRSLKKG